ncbi:MAG: L,D-transpeptidase family protein [Candidatus Margulisbacteria bacterium]|nr:L,D-transpeptidase family protein [Candidatus Margulisiibacteriota bacterium]
MFQITRVLIFIAFVSSAFSSDNFFTKQFEKNYLKAATKQFVLVVQDKKSISKARVYAYEKLDNKWVQAFPEMPACIGYNGITLNKREGDGMSPAGLFSFGFMFGTAPNPGVKYEYRLVTDNQFWVDDTTSDLYNTWQTGPVSGRWKSAEKLNIKDYKYAVVINYNTENVVRGNGSAIFLHVMTKPSTTGCTSMKEGDLLKVLKWLTPENKPLIIQEPAEFFADK